MARLSGVIRDLQRLALIRRDGNECCVCGVAGFPEPILKANGSYDRSVEARTFAEKLCVSDKPYRYLDVEHMDQSDRAKKKNRLEDLRLTCHSCNQKAHREWKQEAIRGHGDPLQSGNGPICVGTVGVSQDFSVSGSVEDKLRDEREPSSGQLRRNSKLQELWPFYLVDVFENSGGAWVDGDDLEAGFQPFVRAKTGLPWGSGETVKRYLRYECMNYGRLQHTFSSSGKELFAWKNDLVRQIMRRQFSYKVPSEVQVKELPPPKTLEEALQQGRVEPDIVLQNAEPERVEGDEADHEGGLDVISSSLARAGSVERCAGHPEAEPAHSSGPANSKSSVSDGSNLDAIQRM